MFYDGWQGLIRVLIVGSAGYVVLVVLLPGSGKRTLTKLNAFSFVVAVALGSTLATMPLSSTVALAEGVCALALLVGLQYGVAWTSTHSRVLERLVKSEPTPVYCDGFLYAAMRRERVTADELRQAARGQGHSDLGAGAVIVLTDGTLSVLTSPPGWLEAPRPGAAEQHKRGDR